ncbi:hypothetical protein ACVMAJ_002544 [Bradyrhizobium sp. USDA 4448]
MIQRHLAQAERHADEGRRLISRQEGLIAKLKKRGHDTADADKVRDILIETQSIHLQDAQRLRGSLSAASRPRRRVF